MNSEGIPKRPVPYSVVKALVHVIAPLLARIHIEGREHVPPKETLLLCTNHLSLIDPPFVALSVSQPVSVMVASEYAHKKPIAALLSLVDAIYVRRGEVDRQALRAVLQRLKAGRSVGIAPEGRRSKSGALEPAKEGAAFVALKAGVRVVPIAIWGSEKVADNLKRLRRTDVYIRVGRPFALDVDPSLPRTAQVEQGTRQIMLAIARMLPAQYQGVYAVDVAREQATAD